LKTYYVSNIYFWLPLPTHTHARALTRANTDRETYIHTCTHACTLAHAHARARTRTQKSPTHAAAVKLGPGALQCTGGCGGGAVVHVASVTRVGDLGAHCGGGGCVRFIIHRGRYATVHILGSSEEIKTRLDSSTQEEEQFYGY